MNSRLGLAETFGRVASGWLEMSVMAAWAGVAPIPITAARGNMASAWARRIDGANQIWLVMSGPRPNGFRVVDGGKIGSEVHDRFREARGVARPGDAHKNAVVRRCGCAQFKPWGVAEIAMVRHR